VLHGDEGESYLSEACICMYHAKKFDTSHSTPPQFHAT
jgi:hypothetical protein